MNAVEVVEVVGNRVKFTVTQRHPDAVGMSVVLQEDLLKLVGNNAFGDDENYNLVPTTPLGHALGSDEVFYDGSGPERFKQHFSVVESNIVRERCDDHDVHQMLNAQGLLRGSREWDDAFHKEFDGRRGLTHVTLEANDPKWVQHISAGTTFEI